MKKLYVILLCALQIIYCMDDYSAPAITLDPVIVLDVELLTDETPKDQGLVGILANVSHTPTLLRTFGIWDLCRLQSNQKKILAHANTLKKTTYGATNIIQSALQQVNLDPNEPKVKTLLDIGFAAEVKNDGLELIKKLTANEIPLMLATHHDVYHLQRYAAYLKKCHGITLKDFFPRGAVVFADPYNSKYEGIAPTHAIVEQPRPSPEYASAIKTLAADRPVILFDTNAQIVAEYSSSKSLSAYHAATATDVEGILQEQGYILDAISSSEQSS